MFLGIVDILNVHRDLSGSRILSAHVVGSLYWGQRGAGEGHYSTCRYPAFSRGDQIDSGYPMSQVGE